MGTPVPRLATVGSHRYNEWCVCSPLENAHPTSASQVGAEITPSLLLESVSETEEEIKYKAPARLCWHLAPPCRGLLESHPSFLELGTPCSTPSLAGWVLSPQIQSDSQFCFCGTPVLSPRLHIPDASLIPRPSGIDRVTILTVSGPIARAGKTLTFSAIPDS